MPLLQAVTDLATAELHTHLNHLQTAEFLYETGRLPASAYTFKHALTHEVAYGSLLQERRRVVHGRAAQAIEELFAERLSEHYYALAHHYSRSGHTAEAVNYLHRAGQQGLERSAYAEAVSHLTTALDLLTSLPETRERSQLELDLQATLGPAVMAIKGYASREVAQAYARARELCLQVGETPQVFEVLLGLCTFYQERAELRTAHELAEQLLHLAQRLLDPISLLWAHNALGYTLHFMGEFVQARTHFEQSLALYNPHTPRAYGFVLDPGVDCLCALAQILLLLGYPDQALQRGQEALTLARELSHPFSLALALHCAARIHRQRGEQRSAQALEEASLALCREQGFAHGLAQGTALHGWDLVKQGQAEAGLTQMHQGLEGLRATGAEVERPWILTSLAMAYGNAGQPDEGLALLSEALDIVDKMGKNIDKSGLYRCKGELLLMQEGLGHKTKGARRELAAEAETYFHQALTIARQQEAKTLELRAAMSLIRLWQRQGKRIDAHQLLAEVYGWFTEGFDTADLRAAKALLDALA